VHDLNDLRLGVTAGGEVERIGLVDELHDVPEGCVSLCPVSKLYRGPSKLPRPFSRDPRRTRVNALIEIAGGFIIVWCFPNTQQILANFKPALEVTAADRKPALLS